MITVNGDPWWAIFLILFMAMMLCSVQGVMVSEVKAVVGKHVFVALWIATWIAVSCYVCGWMG